jgi:limonene-1,2-epoxide hydrolase
MQASAGEPQIQALLSFLADSMVYEHPRAHATISGKGAYGAGLRHFLGSTHHARIRVLRTLVNGGVVVTEQELSFEVQREGSWVPDGRTQVTVFDVENGRITHILDFWQPPR